MKKIKKSLVVLSILLFIGVSVAPSINTNIVKASDDNDLVEVTTQACGIKGYGNTIVKLTREQYQDLEQYLVEFRARLNQTSTREEAVPIFKDVVVELEKYGLLPRGMSVERAQRLTTFMFCNQKTCEVFQRLGGGNLNNESSNMFCLVAGKATNVKSFGAFYPFRFFFVSLCDDLNSDFGLVIWAISELFLVVRSAYFPLYLFGEFSIGHYQYMPQVGEWYYPSNGSFLSLGMSGLKTYSGSLYGQIRKYYYVFTSEDIYYSGIEGFTGINIGLSGGNFLIGSCLLIDIGPSPSK
jgi:hypothetical protein